MTYRFVHLGVNFGGDIPWTQFVDSQMNRISFDWLRYSANDWIIWTNKPTFQLTHEIRNLVSANDQFMLFDVSVGAKDGWHYQWVWDWLNTPRDPVTGVRQGVNPLAALLGPPAAKGLPPKKN